MQRLRTWLFLTIFALPICTSEAKYRLEITPQTKSDIFEMTVESTVNFQATGYAKKEGEVLEIPVQIDKIWWNFDKGIFAKINSSATSITLKAVRPGLSQLTAVAIMKNQSRTQTLSILVKESQVSKAKIKTLPKKRKGSSIEKRL